MNDIEGSNIEQIIAKTQRNINKSENIEIYNNVNIYLDEIYKEQNQQIEI